MPTVMAMTGSSESHCHVDGAAAVWWGRATTGGVPVRMSEVVGKATDYHSCWEKGCDNNHWKTVQRHMHISHTPPLQLGGFNVAHINRGILTLPILTLLLGT